jgi:hypothetical protein
LSKKLIKNSSKTHQKLIKKNLITKFIKTCQKLCQNIVKKLSNKIVKQDPRGKQVPFMSPKTGFQEAPHAPQGDIELKKWSGIKTKNYKCRKIKQSCV